MLELDKIHTTDCFSATTQLPDAGVDVIITDPPYPNRNHQFEDTLVDGLAMLYLGCKKAKKYVIFFWNPFNVPPPPPGWFEVARHVWHKPDCRTIIHYEVIVVWSREEKSKPSKVWSIPILDYRSLRDWKPHPTQKPVKLLRYLIEDYTNEGDVVFDPFVGSGTTAVACQWAKRHFIACEINPEYAAIATSPTNASNRTADDVMRMPRANASDSKRSSTMWSPGGTATARSAPSATYRWVG